MRTTWPFALALALTTVAENEAQAQEWNAISTKLVDRYASWKSITMRGCDTVIEKPPTWGLSAFGRVWCVRSDGSAMIAVWDDCEGPRTSPLDPPEFTYIDTASKRLVFMGSMLPGYTITTEQKQFEDGIYSIHYDDCPWPVIGIILDRMYQAGDGKATALNSGLSRLQSDVLSCGLEVESDGTLRSIERWWNEDGQTAFYRNDFEYDIAGMPVKRVRRIDVKEKPEHKFTKKHITEYHLDVFLNPRDIDERVTFDPHKTHRFRHDPSTGNLYDADGKRVYNVNDLNAAVDRVIAGRPKWWQLAKPWLLGAAVVASLVFLIRRKVRA